MPSKYKPKVSFVIVGQPVTTIASAMKKEISTDTQETQKMVGKVIVDVGQLCIGSESITKVCGIIILLNFKVLDKPGVTILLITKYT